MTSHPTSFKMAAAATLAGGLVALAGTAQAAITVYTTPATFTAASTTPFTDTFNDLQIDFAASPLMRMNGLYGYSISASGCLYPAGTQGGDVWLSTNLSGTTMTFGDFTAGVRSLGGLFFGSDIAGAFLPGQTLTLTAVDSIGASTSFTLANATQTSFVGFVSNALLVSVSVATDPLGSWVSANNLVLANAPGVPIPEPSAAAMLLAGLAAVAGLARRRHGAG